LFDIFKKENKQKKTEEEFEEIEIECSNVQEALIDTSKKYKIPVSFLDFKIIEVKTFIKMGDTELVEADEEMMKLIETEKFLSDEKNIISQTYKIKIFKHKEEFEILGEMQVDKDLTKAVFILLKINDFKKIDFNRLTEELNKKKLKNNFLIKLCDKKMLKDIDEISSKIIVEEQLNEDAKITLCECLKPIPTIQGKIEYIYQKFKEQNGNVFIFPVKKNDVLIKITKPKEGRNGRNCRGEIIKVEKLKDFSYPDISYDEKSIKVIENENEILFVAIKDGYVKKEDDKYSIDDKLDIQQVNIRTGNIKGADESDVKMNIKESDSLKEAIADGMVVESTEVNVKGNVGNKAIVKSKILNIEGQTHQNSKIYTIDAKINAHKGYLKAKNAVINSLEGGIVEANRVEIKKARGGEIIAKEVLIHNLHSHVKIYALTQIKILNLNGDENLFCISPKKVLKEVDIKKYEEELNEVRNSISKIKKEIEKTKALLLKNKGGYLKLKKIYEENKKRGIKTAPSALMKMKQYQELNQKYKNLNEKLKNLEQKEKDLLETIDNIQNGIYNAKIISCSSWTPYNRIEFDLLEPPVVLRYDTKEEGICAFKLSKEELKIVKVKVEDDWCVEGENS